MNSQLKIDQQASNFSKLMLVIFALLQLLRLPRLPQFMDIYYHLQVAWGFIQAGGYSSWDFWEFAPFGRPHIYPPLFQILLALLIKLGVSVIFLAKFFESAAPVIFLLVIWNFIRKNFSQQLGFFVVIAFGSSFIFSISLANHIPSTLALIFGFLSFGEFFKNRLLRATILLVLCFYTHIAVSWFFAFSYVFYAMMDESYRRNSFRIVVYALPFALPILIMQLLNLQAIHLVGNNMFEKFHLQIKVFDYIPAVFGLFLAVKMNIKRKFFISLFLASFIFLSYPHRFLSAEGYISVILFSALTMHFIWQRLKEKMFKVKEIFMGLILIFVLFISPTLFLDKPAGSHKISYKIDWIDSAFSGLLFAKGNSIWYPWMYLPIVDIIKANSNSQDIVYSNLDTAGLILSSLAQRATANGLLLETRSFQRMDYFSFSNIIVLPNDLDQELINSLSNKYHLIKINKNKYFSVFRNPAPVYGLKIIKAVVSFPVIIGILFLLAVLFWGKELAWVFRDSLKNKNLGP
jgi:hypothetical protein